MDKQRLATILQEGGRLVSMAMHAYPRRKPPAELVYPSVEIQASSLKQSSSSPTEIRALQLPTTAETLQELKRRLGKELYRIELDLQGGGRIAGRPCDCLSKKHNLGIEATAEELMSYETGPVYGEIVTWLRAHEAEFEPAEIAKHPPDYYRALTPEVRGFRKRVMGTDDALWLRKAIMPTEVLKDYPELQAKQITTEETSAPATEGAYVAILDKGDTVFQEGDTISHEAYEKENERVRKLGKRPAYGKRLGEIFPELPLYPNGAPNIELLAITEGDPISKFCCRQCGECAPRELLEEGRFPERIGWLRRHYREKHPGIWGKIGRVPETENAVIRPVEEEEFIPDSPEFLAQSIKDCGWREKLDEAFLSRMEKLRKTKDAT